MVLNDNRPITLTILPAPCCLCKGDFRQSLRLLLLLLSKLFLGFRNHFLELGYGGNGWRAESIFCVKSPNRSAVEGILSLSTINDECVLRWSNFGLGMRTGRGRICRDRRRRPMLGADPHTGVDRLHDYGTIIRGTANCGCHCFTVAAPDRDDQIRIRRIHGH